MKLPKFKILTSKSILDIPYKSDEQHERDCLELVEEQNAIIEKNLYNNKSIYLLHFFDSAFFDDHYAGFTIDEGIEALAIKDGYDIVEYENRNIGFVAYYNSYYNGFEVIRDRYAE